MKSIGFLIKSGQSHSNDGEKKHYCDYEASKLYSDILKIEFYSEA